jgi:putative transposase
MAAHRTVLTPRLRQFISESELETIAQETGFGKRKRKCPPLVFFWTLVLGASCEAKKSLAGLRRFFQQIAGLPITSAAFQKRFTEESANYFEKVFYLLLERSLGNVKRLPRKLRRFRDVISADSTAFTLHRKLAKYFRGFKSLGTEATARITATMSLATHTLEQVTLTSGRRSETRFFPITKDLRGKLVLFDLGFFAIWRLQALKAVGADFICRLKEKVNPTILAVHQGSTGRKKVVGRKFRDVRFSGPWVDLDVKLGVGSKAIEVRLVGCFNKESGEYHFYLTSICRGLFGPGEISEAYRLRWQVELLFRELKDICNLDHVPTTKKWTARCLIFAALITHLLSRYIAQLLTKWRPWELSPQKWTRFLLGYAQRIGRLLLRGKTEELEELLGEIRLCSQGECKRGSPSGVGVYGSLLC